MSRHFLALFIASLVFVAPKQVHGFSLLGLRPSWQTPEVGLAPPYDSIVGGVMQIGEGYRFNMPVITYAYDASFLRYFGADGVAAIESAMKVLNGIPTADSMSETLEEFPLNTIRHNATASALSILDLKTTALSLMLEQLGVASPENYVWSIRAHAGIAGIETFSVFNPNFDPVTLQRTPYINGYQYTYNIELARPGEWKAFSSPVDPLGPGFTTVAGYIQASFFGSTAPGRGALLASAPGVYFPALTREDVGTFRYLLSTKNYAVESLLPDVIASTGGAIGVSGGTTGGGGGIGGGGLEAIAAIGGIGGIGRGFSGGSGEPWIPAFSVLAGGIGSANPPWSIVTVSTNVAANGVVVTPLSTGLPRVVNALRPGVGKYQFVQIGYDSILGASTRPYLVTWLDRYITNNATRVQAVARQITVPDFLFSAGDLGVVMATPVLILKSVDGYVDNSALNNVGGVQSADLAGPGIITSGKNLSFSKIGRYYYNRGLGGEPDAFIFGGWGSYDGSTNAPVLYPTGTSIKGVEKLVLGGR